MMHESVLVLAAAHATRQRLYWLAKKGRNLVNIAGFCEIPVARDGTGSLRSREDGCPMPVLVAVPSSRFIRHPAEAHDAGGEASRSAPFNERTPQASQQACGSRALVFQPTPAV
jgi:hypothetical protein